MDIQCYYLWLPILQIADIINGNNMNRGRMETEHSRLHEVYVKFFEICQKDTYGVGEELEVIYRIGKMRTV